MKNIILFCFVIAFTTCYAQKHPTQNTKCQLIVEDILREQTFDIDEPISETAMYVLEDMYQALNSIYTTDANDPQRIEHIQNFQLALQKANTLNLNLIMFNEDIEYVSNLTQ